jgi:hypothetical protein
MEATAPRIVHFAPTPGIGPLYDVLLWGVDEAIPAEQVDFQGVTLTVVPEPSSYALAA